MMLCVYDANDRAIYLHSLTSQVKLKLLVYTNLHECCVYNQKSKTRNGADTQQQQRSKPFAMCVRVCIGVRESSFAYIFKPNIECMWLVLLVTVRVVCLFGIDNCVWQRISTIEIPTPRTVETKHTNLAAMRMRDKEQKKHRPK